MDEELGGLAARLRRDLNPGLATWQAGTLRATLQGAVNIHKDILMDMKTDHTMIARKAETWKKVTQQFNAAGMCPPKACQQIKRMWEHHKSK